MICNKIYKDGYIILKNVFTEQQLLDCQTEINNYIKTNKTIKNCGGVTIPDFIRRKGLSKTAELKENTKIHEALIDYFQGNDYRFCGHNDIGINRIADWHKDKLNGEYAKYETINIWDTYESEKHEILKVLIYLENHKGNNDGLKLIPKSHLNRKIEVDQNKVIQLKPELGDVIIFDQRITHRGMEKQVKYPRILVAFGFGKNNIFTDNFEKGTVARQNDQNKIL